MSIDILLPIHHSGKHELEHGLVWQRCVPTEAQRLARIDASEFYSAQIDASADPDGGWDPDCGLDDDTFGASWNDEALDEPDA